LFWMEVEVLVRTARVGETWRAKDSGKI